MPTIYVSPETIYDVDDFTYYSSSTNCLDVLLSTASDAELTGLPVRNPRFGPTLGGASGLLRRAWRLRDPVRSSYMSFSDTLTVKNGTAEVTGRGLVCSCYAATCVSATVRKATSVFPASWPPPAPAAPQESGYYKAHESSAEHPIPIYWMADTLDEVVFGRRGSGSPRKGLVVLFGETAACKSQLARALVHLYLSHFERCPREKRLPHLVTLEDPIDALYCKTPADAATTHAASYTPRQLGVDVESLEQGLHDALRQTPSVVFVGEVRKAQDWRSLIDFAGTGHLVVTTAHAGSLIESMENIFHALEAVTPAHRGFVAQRLLALVHLESQRYGKASVTLPSVWRRTASGLAGLVADGLSSIIPGLSADEHESCIGRAYFADKWSAFDQARQAGNAPAPAGCPARADPHPTGDLLTKHERDQLWKDALAHDLRRP